MIITSIRCPRLTCIRLEFLIILFELLENGPNIIDVCVCFLLPFLLLCITLLTVFVCVFVIFLFLSICLCFSLFLVMSYCHCFASCCLFLLFLICFSLFLISERLYLFLNFQFSRFFIFLQPEASKHWTKTLLLTSPVWRDYPVMRSKLAGSPETKGFSTSNPAWMCFSPCCVCLRLH